MPSGPARCCILILILLSSLQILHAQLKFAEGSKLASQEYLEHQIRTISDSDLFSSLSLDLPGLAEMKRAVRRNDPDGAYRAWATYWSSKLQPKYVSQPYRLLIDTEMLEDYDQARSYCVRNPEEKDTILSRASMIMRNVFQPWGDVIVDFGAKVDFNREIGQSGKYGFHYWVWSRALILAYVNTGDQKYLAKFDGLFNQWYEQRNDITRGFPNLDVVYYELGLGMRNRMFLEYYFLPFEQRSVQSHERMLKTFLAAGRWLYQLQRWEGYRPGNWQIHGSYMLAQLAMALPEFRESHEWLDIALQRLQEHLRQDFFPDGGHSERAPKNYTQATYLSYRNLYYLLSVYHVREDLAAEIHQRMGNTIDWWITMLTPTGEIPAINDSHRGLFPVFLLKDGEQFYGKPYVEGILKNLFGLQPGVPEPTLPPFVSRHMPESGFTVMRSDWTRDALYMNINYGKWSGFHTHNDLLDFEVYAFGKALAVDAGIGLTYDDPLYIPWYQSSRAHNMVTVNDRNMRREGIEGEHVLWDTTAHLEYFSADHNGYASVGVHHRRQIVFVNRQYWVILDELRCEREGDTLSWYLHSPTELMRTADGFCSERGPGIVVQPIEGGGHFRTGTGMASSTSDLTPGKTEQIGWISFDQITQASSTMRYSILLYPFRDRSESPSCEAVSPTHVRLRWPGKVDDLFASDGKIQEGGIESDARVVLLHHEGTKATRFSLLNGTFLRIKGTPVWASPLRVSAEGVMSK